MKIVSLGRGCGTILASFAFASCALIVFVAPMSAALGGDISSVQQDGARMKGTVRMTQKQAFSVHEIQGSAGMVVREYASPEGKVFGLAWQGSGHPDMSQLLGTYFGQYERAIQNKRIGRGPILVQQSGLVVQTGGHARWFTGKAYVPSMVPGGVTQDQIK